MDTCSILGNDTVLVSVTLPQVGYSEVVLSDGGVVALQPTVVVPFVCAVDFPLHHISHDLAATVVERHGPAQGNGGAADVCYLWFTRRIWERKERAAG